MSAARPSWFWVPVPVPVLVLVLTHSASASGDIQFLERREGESVVLPCVAQPSERPPFGLYLMRGWLRPGEVLFKYTGEKFHTEDPADQERLSVSGDPELGSLNITIARLTARDSDRYRCHFMVSEPSGEDRRLDGLTEYFLHISPGAACGCSSYSTLLYALSSAVAVLLLLLLAGSLLLWKGKARRSGGTQPQSAIYEEMVGRKPASRRLDDGDCSEYRNCPVNKSCPENHYEIPGGGLK